MIRSREEYLLDPCLDLLVVLGIVRRQVKFLIWRVRVGDHETDRPQEATVDTIVHLRTTRVHVLHEVLRTHGCYLVTQHLKTLTLDTDEDFAVYIDDRSAEDLFDAALETLIILEIHSTFALVSEFDDLIEGNLKGIAVSDRSELDTLSIHFDLELLIGRYPLHTCFTLDLESLVERRARRDMCSDRPVFPEIECTESWREGWQSFVRLCASELVMDGCVVVGVATNIRGGGIRGCTL